MTSKLLYTLVLLFCLTWTNKVQSQDLHFGHIDSLILNGKPESALSSIKKQTTQNAKLSDLHKAELLFIKAKAHYDLGDFTKSAESSGESIELIKSNKDNYVNYYYVVDEYVNAKSKLRDYKPALKACKEAIENLNNAPSSKPEHIIGLHIKQAKIHSRNSEFDLSEEQLSIAEELLKKALDEQKKIDLKKSLLAARASLYARTGRMKESIVMTSDLLEIAIQEKDSSKITSHNNTIALNYFRLGDYGKCKHHVEQSMSVNLKRYSKEDPKMLRNYSHMGVVSMKLEDYDTAQEYYNRTYTIIEKTMGTENLEMASLTFNLGVSHFQKQEFSEALPKFKESLQLRRKLLGENHAEVAHSTQIIGATLLGQEKMTEAIPYLEKALSIRLKLGNPLDPELTRIYSNLAICYQFSEEIEKAQTNVDAAYETIGYDKSAPFDFDNLIAPFMFSNPLELDIALATDRYKLSGKDEDYAILQEKSLLADSIQNYLKFYLDDPGSRMVATAKNMLVYDELMNGYYERYIKTTDDEVIQKVFSLFEKSKNTMMYEKLAEESSESTIGMPNELIDQKFALEDSIAFYQELSYAAEGQELAQILENVNGAKSAYYQHLEKIKSTYPKFYEAVYDYPIISIEEYSKNLSDQEATISYFFGNGNTYGILFKNGTYELKSCGESIVIDSLFPIFIADLEKRNEPKAYVSSSEAMYSILLEPFDLSGVQHLNILADNMLSLIPFEVLIDPSTNKFVMESHSISYHYSATLQMKSRALKPKKGELLAMAPIFESEEQNTLYAGVLDQDIFRDNLRSLPNSENEVDAISSIFGGIKLTKNKATETAFKKHAPDSHVLHLATHGFVNHSSPDNSSLYFYPDTNEIDDGKLHAFEIVNMNLNADLVTLSACNTGVGAIQKGEGIASIGRAFAYAGCPNQLISLWPANDKSTTTIMTNFYQNIENGDTKAQALHHAKQQYLASSPELFKHPYYWSGFVYYGNDDQLQITKGLESNWLWLLFGIVIVALITYLTRRKST